MFFFTADERQFTLVHTDREFFIEEGTVDLQSRQPESKNLSYINNPNRPISEQEFAEPHLGDQTRALINAGPVTVAGHRRGWLSRLRSSRT